MKRIHVPGVNARYWVAITLASVVGTNLGDLYAHESGLGLLGGLCLLAALGAATFLVERRDDRVHEAYYWLAILIIRTGATNIADHLAFRVRIPPVTLAVGLVMLLAALVWRMRRVAARARTEASDGLPDTDAAYWAAMLTAGVLGTVLGDDFSRLVGQGTASISLGVLLGLVLLLTRGAAVPLGAYWGTVAVARTAGTAVGDWLAENRLLSLGLPLSTMLTGFAFLAVLLWRGQRVAGPVGDRAVTR